MPGLRLINLFACPAGLKVEGADRRIAGPIYNLPEFQSRVGAGIVKLFFATSDSDDDLIELDWDLTNVRGLISALNMRAYRNSQWCETTARKWIPCDAYLLNFNEETNLRDSNCPTYYLKFGFLPNIDGTAAIVSVHRGY